MLPLNFFFEPVLSVISLTLTVFTYKISLPLKAVRQFSHRRTDVGHNLVRHDEPVDIFLAISVRMRIQIAHL